MQAVTKDDARTQGENGRLEELLLRRKAEVTVLTEKRRRLEGQLEHQEREARALRLAGDRLQVGVELGADCQVQRCDRCYCKRKMRVVFPYLSKGTPVCPAPILIHTHIQTHTLANSRLS